MHPLLIQGVHCCLRRLPAATGHRRHFIFPARWDGRKKSGPNNDLWSAVKNSCCASFTLQGVAVPGKQRFFRFIPINLFHIADVQVMVAHLMVFLQIADNRHAAVDGNLNGAALHVAHCNVEGGNHCVRRTVPGHGPAAAPAFPGCHRLPYSRRPAHGPGSSNADAPADGHSK